MVRILFAFFFFFFFFFFNDTATTEIYTLPYTTLFRSRHPVVPGHRQEGAERAPGGQAAGLEDRHQERGREAAGGRAADVGAGGAAHHPAGEGGRPERGSGGKADSGGRD